MSLVAVELFVTNSWARNDTHAPAIPGPGLSHRVYAIVIGLDQFLWLPVKVIGACQHHRSPGPPTGLLRYQQGKAHHLGYMPPSSEAVLQFLQYLPGRERYPGSLHACMKDVQCLLQYPAGMVLYPDYTHP